MLLPDGRCVASDAQEAEDLLDLAMNIFTQCVVIRTKAFAFSDQILVLGVSEWAFKSHVPPGWYLPFSAIPAGRARRKNDGCREEKVTVAVANSPELPRRHTIADSRQELYFVKLDPAAQSLAFGVVLASLRTFLRARLSTAVGGQSRGSFVIGRKELPREVGRQIRAAGIEHAETTRNQRFIVSREFGPPFRKHQFRQSVTDFVFLSAVETVEPYPVDFRIVGFPCDANTHSGAALNARCPQD
jgi:hypothetical protein